MGDTQTDNERFDAFVAAVADLERMLEERDKTDDFNIFEVTGIVNAEIRHSNTIAWLMNPRGKHGLGGRVLAGLIEHAGGVAPDDLDGFTVKREADRIDILAVSTKDRMVLAVENKIWSGEHDDQLGRYQRIIETRYREWKHFFLYLTPNDDSPEGDEDAEVWETLGYADLADIVQSAMSGIELKDKPRILIEDYLECIRRHIVGDEELTERCMQIYAEHKQAIDLIMRSLPKADKVVHDYARDWVRRLEGAYVVEKVSGGRKFVRFRTDRLDEFFPPIDKTDSWGQHSFWFYELVSVKSNDGLSCTLKLQLCFNHPKMANLSREATDAMMAFTEAFAGEERRWFYKDAYSGYAGRRVQFNPSGIGYMDVAEVCDEFWRDFERRESTAIDEVFG